MKRKDCSYCLNSHVQSAKWDCSKAKIKTNVSIILSKSEWPLLELTQISIRLEVAILF